MAIFDALTDRLERAEALDRPTGSARDTVSKILTNRTVKDALHGVWLGHPLHPALAQLTLGSFTSAAPLDALGTRRRGSTTPITAGLLTTAPTVAAGWADYADAHEEQQRVAIVHAAGNATAVALFTTALIQRARGGRGRSASILGGTLAGVAAWLGAHLTYRQSLGPHQGAPLPHTGPDDWQPLGPLTDLPDGAAVRRKAGDVEVPATAPLPGFATRVVDGVVQARVHTHLGIPAS